MMLHVVLLTGRAAERALYYARARARSRAELDFAALRPHDEGSTQRRGEEDLRLHPPLALAAPREGRLQRQRPWACTPRPIAPARLEETNSARSSRGEERVARCAAA